MALRKLKNVQTINALLILEIKMRNFQDYFDIAYDELITEETLSDFGKVGYVSDLTKSFYKKDGGYTINSIDVKKNKSGLISQIWIKLTSSKSNKESKYIQKIKFVTPTSLNKIKKTDVKLSCSCPAFTSQGMNYKLHTIGSAIKKEERPDSTWGPRHNEENYLCKHLYHIIKNFTKITKEYNL